MEGNNIKIVTIGILLTFYMLFGCPYFLHYNSWYVSLAHHFFHVSIFHLAVNSISLWFLFRKGVRYGIIPLLLAYVIGSISWFCSSADPVGFSNIIFALVGLRTPSLKTAWWRHPSVITFFVVTALMALIPGVSAITHIVSFILGCLTAGGLRIINHINRDFRRATYC